jgi:diguanylate cyclase (GGDEF)-like protein
MSDSQPTNLPDEYIEQLQQRLHELEKIMEVGRELTSKQSLTELLKLILVTASDLVESEVASIILKDVRTEKLHIRVSFQPEQIEDVVELDIPVPVDGSIAGEIYTSGKPLIVPDLREDTRHFTQIDEKTGYETRNLLGVPLMVEDQKLGVLMVTNKKGGLDFSLSDQEILVVLSAHAAVSIENARLYAELQTYADQLEDLVAERTADLEKSNEQLQMEIEVRKRAEAELEKLARTDPLTSIFNRRYFFELAAQEYNRALRYDYPLSAVLLDLDHFKQVNDRHGHLAGDQVLMYVGKVVGETLREVDIWARYGGEEFVLLLPETDPAQGKQTAERLRTMLEKAAIPTEGGDISISASLGVASLGGGVGSLEELLDRADQALYQAKEGGRNQVVSFG